MNKKSTLSILLAFVITISTLIAISGTVFADGQGSQNGSNDTQPSFETSPVTKAGFELAVKPVKIQDSGYTDITCEFSELTFGEVEDGWMSNELELTISKYGNIINETSDIVGSFKIMNADHSSSNLRFNFINGQNNGRVQFDFSIYIEPNLYDNLTPGKYTLNINFSSTWKNCYSYTEPNKKDIAGPNIKIAKPMRILEPANPAEYTLLPKEYTITHADYSDIECSFDYLNFGKVTDNNGNEAEAKNISFTVKSGTLTDGNNHSVAFELANKEHTFHSNNMIDLQSYDSEDDTFTIPIYIKPADYYSLPAGTYTGYLECKAIWGTTSNTFANGKTRFIKLMIVIPESTVLATGKCGATNNDNLTWTLYNNGLLKITGSGAMKDYESYTYTAPWRQYKSQLACVVLDSGITHIGNCAFYFCDKVNSVTIPDTVTTIGSSAFTYCKNLSDVIIPNSVSAIGSSAFSNCDSLTTIIIPDSVTVMERMAFYGSGLKTVGIGKGLTSIPESAFGGAELTSVDIPATITTIEKNAFMTCYKLASVTLHDGLTTIGENAFSASAITTITIPDTVTSIGDSAFSNCTSLASIKLSSRLTTIVDRTFFQCTSLESVTIPSGVTSVGINAFYGCKDLSEVVLPNGLLTIGSRAFCKSESLKTITLPSGLESIGESAFEQSGLTSVVIPDSVTEIGRTAFKDCSELASATLSKNCAVLPECIFEDCQKLQSVEIPEGVTTIEYEAFDNCDSFTSIKIPNSVTTIGEAAFMGCDNLKTVELSSGITSIAKDTFSFCRKLEGIRIPQNVTVIGEKAFYNCDALSYVSVPEKLEKINRWAFWDCTSLKTFVIPSTVTYIGPEAFRSCQNVTDVYCYASPDTLTWEVGTYGDFKSNNETKCHVLNRLSDYETKFKDIQVTFVLDGFVDIQGYTISLAGDIGVNFWFNLSEGCGADDYILFTVNGKTEKVKVSEAEKGTNGVKIFTCGVSAKEMTDIISAQFHLADGTAVGKAYTYTVREYADYILTHNTYSEKAKELAKAMLNYGACSQKYFNYKTDNLANSVLSNEDQIVNILDPDDIIPKTNGDSDINVLPAKVSLILESTITLKLYFNDADVEGMTFKQNGQTLSYTKSNGYTVVKIEKITANWLGSGVVVDFYKDNAKVGYLIYSPIKYCKLVLKQPTGEVYTEDLKRVVSALYLFSDATQKYTQSIHM